MCKVSRFQLKIIHHTKEQKNLHLNEKRQSTDTNIRMTELLELSEKNFQATIMKILQQAITNTLRTLKK